MYISTNTCIKTNVCMSRCIWACMNTCMTCMYVRMYAYMYVRMYACMYVSTCCREGVGVDHEGGYSGVKSETVDVQGHLLYRLVHF